MQEKIVRKMDELGRIVLPQEFRRAMDWNDGTNISITRDGNKLILQENSCSCILCGNEKKN